MGCKQQEQKAPPIVMHPTVAHNIEERQENNNSRATRIGNSAQGKRDRKSLSRNKSNVCFEFEEKERDPVGFTGCALRRTKFSKNQQYITRCQNVSQNPTEVPRERWKRERERKRGMHATITLRSLSGPFAPGKNVKTLSRT